VVCIYVRKNHFYGLISTHLSDTNRVKKIIAQNHNQTSTSSLTELKVNVEESQLIMYECGTGVKKRTEARSGQIDALWKVYKKTDIKMNL
jgi:hypothetical protein